MIQPPANSFHFLAQFWPDLSDLGNKAEKAIAGDPDVTAVRLRSFTETMVAHLFRHFGIPLQDTGTHFDRLVLLERDNLLDRILLAKFHAIRKIGNLGAHNGQVTSKQAESLVADAWSLGCWFCRLMRPDIDWLIRPYGSPVPLADADRAGPAGVPPEPDEQPTGADDSNVFAFPQDRIRKIRDAVNEAYAQVDPRVRQLQTRITLREAFTEQLTPDQEACLAALELFLTDRTKRIFLLKGDAGTGKTFLAKGLIDYLSAQGRAYQLGAPTGRAAKIIGEKSGRPARTLHSLIYDYGALKEYGGQDDPQGLETFKVYAEIAGNREQANAVYIVDEASLISDVYAESDFFRCGSGYLLHDLMTYVGFDRTDNDRKIIFLGDPAQLQPVQMSTSPALDADYLREYFGQSPVQHHLRDIVRQKAGSGVLQNVRPLREGLETKTFRGLQFAFDDDVAHVQADDVLPRYAAIVAGMTADLPIIVTRSNAEAAELNQSVRSRLFPGRDRVAEGDRLLVVGNTRVGGHFLANGEFVKVITAEPMVERRTVTIRQRKGESDKVESSEIHLIFRDIEVALSLADGTEAVLGFKVLDTLLHDGQAGLSAEEQRALYVDFLKRHPDLRRSDPESVSRVIRQDPYFNAVRAKFGYAVTCHKAQGGEWEHVFVICPGRQDPRNADYFRWLYTAMTRSRSKLYLVNPPEVRIAVAGPAASSLGAFREGLLNRVRDMLADTGIAIDDVAHNQYQEALYLSRDADSCRVNVSYNGKFKVGAIAIAQEGAFRDALAGLLAPLVGQTIGAPEAAAEGGGKAASPVPSRAFLKEFHDRLTPLLAARSITVASLKEQQWSQRYTFARQHESAVVDIYYDGRNRFKRCLPIGPKAFSDNPGNSLLHDVLEVITTEITP